MYLTTGRLSLKNKVKVEVLPWVMPWGALAAAAVGLVLLAYNFNTVFMLFYEWLVVPLSNVLP